MSKACKVEKSCRKDSKTLYLYPKSDFKKKNQNRNAYDQRSKTKFYGYFQ